MENVLNMNFAPLLHAVMEKNGLTVDDVIWNVKKNLHVLMTAWNQDVIVLLDLLEKTVHVLEVNCVHHVSVTKYLINVKFGENI